MSSYPPPGSYPPPEPGSESGEHVGALRKPDKTESYVSHSSRRTSRWLSLPVLGMCSDVADDAKSSARD